MIIYRVYSLLTKDLVQTYSLGLNLRECFIFSTKTLVCNKVIDCIKCTKYGVCSIGAFLEPTITTSRGKLIPASRQYVIVPKGIIQHELVFDIIIIGKIKISEELIVRTVIEMGANGIIVSRDIVNFSVLRIRRINTTQNRDELIYDHKMGYISSKLEYSLDPFNNLKIPHIDKSKDTLIVLDFYTPTRIRDIHSIILNNTQIPSLKGIIMSISRRLFNLYRIGVLERPIPRKLAIELKDSLLRHAVLLKDKTRTLKVNIKWYSRIKKRWFSHRMFIGRVAYRVSADIWKSEAVNFLLLRLLEIGKFIGIGINASAGCGRYKLLYVTI